MVINVEPNQVKGTERYNGDALRGITDPNLNLEALSLWMRICSLPENTEFTLEELQSRFFEATPTAYQALIDAGYIEE